MTLSLRSLALAAVVGLLAVGGTGCDLVGLDDRPSPNGPSLDGILANPTEAILSNVAVGVEASARVRLGTYLVDVGVIGREYWRFSTSDPRFTQDLLGAASSTLDNNTFYITAPWGARYATIRTANTLLQGLEANTTLTDGEKASARGFAKTWIAYQYLLNLNLTYENGIRFIGPGDDEAGPIVGYDEALNRIAQLLDEANADFQAGSGFFFPTSGGVGTRAANRALAARVDAYREDWQGVLDALAGSFIDPAGDLAAGAYHPFSNNAGDITNPFFFPLNTSGDGVLAHPDYLADIEAGDNRRNKVEARSAAFTFDGLTSSFDVDVYPSSVAPLPIIRNAELLLLRAEANAQRGSTGPAINDINVIRTAAGVGPYTGPTDPASVIDEVLFQRRYELYAEGHRWIDMRRYGRLGQLPIDRPGDDVFDRFPIPESDTN